MRSIDPIGRMLTLLLFAAAAVLFGRVVFDDRDDANLRMSMLSMTTSTSNNKAHRCPDPNSGPVAVTGDSITTTVELVRSETNVVCVLVATSWSAAENNNDNNTNETVVVAQSVDGNEWKPSSSFRDVLSFRCNDYKCQCRLVRSTFSDTQTTTKLSSLRLVSSSFNQVSSLEAMSNTRRDDHSSDNGDDEYENDLDDDAVQTPAAVDETHRILDESTTASVSFWACPDGDHQQDTILETHHSYGDNINLPAEQVGILISSPHRLCILAMTDGNEHWVPVARSYSGYEWEPYAGQYFQDLRIECPAVNNNPPESCLMFLPPPASGMWYTLSSSSNDLRPQDEFARFLEQATFGPTTEDIDQMMQDTKGGSLSPRLVMAQWIQDQQNPEVVEPTYHREVFRRHLNARFESSSVYGQVTHPCQAFTMYRRWTFSRKDNDQEVLITRIPGTQWRVLSMHGVNLTVVEGPLYHGDSYSVANQFKDGESHRICKGPKSGTGQEFRLWHGPSERCRDVVIGAPDFGQDIPFEGNPTVQFPAEVAEPPALSVDLDSSVGIVVADESYFQNLIPDQPIQRIRTSHALTDDICEQIVLGSGAVPNVFGQYEGVWFLHDPRFVFRDNSGGPETLQDGGGSIVEQTRGPISEYSALCANTPRSFVNEELCFLSTSLDACSPNPIPDAVGEHGKAVVVCPSPGEVANDLRLGGEIGRGAFDVTTPFNETTPFSLYLEQRRIVWASVALSAKDQLRQRIGWALYQMFVINSSVSGNSQPEEFLQYYDILTRNAFGSFRDVLKQVAFSRLMGEMLSYEGSKSTGYQWSRNQHVVEYPDENFAREIMQLFSIGLNELNADGTVKLKNGKPIRTYNNNVIMELARVWTGFRSPTRRGNSAPADSFNRLDPMTVEPAYRDSFPKLGLRNKYIGHGVPLCADLPAQHFLKKGAKYRLLGSTSRPELLSKDPGRWLNREGADWFVANATAGKDSLYSYLCDAKAPSGPDSQCRYPPIVTLSKNLDCHGEEECSVNSIRTVKINDIFYEYEQLECVHQAFYSNPQKVKKRDWFSYKKAWMCADPRIEAAASMCCPDDGASNNGYGQDLYYGERVKLSVAEARCAALASESPGFSMCRSTGPLRWKEGQPFAIPFFWMGGSPCSLKAKIDGDGKVAVVHSVPDEDSSAPRNKLLTDEDTKTFFGVLWKNQTQATLFAHECPETICSRTLDQYCMCDVQVQEETVFDSVPTRNEVLSRLSIGAFHPDLYDLPYTTLLEENVTVYTFVDSGETIFEVLDDYGKLQRRKNVASWTRIAGTASLAFETPVHFISLQEPTIRDALAETNAAIDQVFFHDNTGPFVAMHLARRFGHSNPSPRFVKAAANAFRSGRYSFNDGDTCQWFGSGSYGDLAATVAAILLDRESRDVKLDKDPSYGHIKEPVNKVLGAMRSLGFKTTPEYPFLTFLKDLQTAISQFVFEAPSIFSFFLAEHQPSGAISRAGLYSPEAEIHSNPQIVSLVNGLIALVKYGHDRCFGGFGPSINSDGDCENRTPLDFTKASGRLSFSPFDDSSAQSIVDELATLLTAGRLSVKSRELIEAAVQSETSKAYSVNKAEQLLLASSEFHTTGTVESKQEVRSKTENRTPSSRPYKAVVVIMLPGGYDSYNLIVPHVCNTTNDAGKNIVDQYYQERDEIGVSADERSILINTTDSAVCQQFAINERMPIVRELYNNDSLAFFLNTGLLNVPVTKHNYDALTQSQLFAHNWMQHELEKVDPYDVFARTGFLGRVTNLLRHPAYGYHARGIGINRQFHAVNSDDTHAPPPIVMSELGAEEFNSKPEKEEFDPQHLIEQLNGFNGFPSSLFGDAFSDLFMTAIEEADFLAGALKNVSLGTNCGSRRLNMAVKMMETREERGADRDAIYLEFLGWDHHKNLKDNLYVRFGQLNDAIECYVENLKHANLWDKVTTVVVSEFGRTLTPNTNLGSDHGWDGHYFAFGNALRGKKIFGDYLRDLTAEGPSNTGRGRNIPGLAWESIFQPVAEWMGVDPEDFDLVLPNAKQTGAELFRGHQMFKDMEDMEQPSPNPTSAPSWKPTDPAPWTEPSELPSTLPSLFPSLDPSSLPSEFPSTPPSSYE